MIFEEFIGFAFCMLVLLFLAAFVFFLYYLTMYFVSKKYHIDLDNFITEKTFKEDFPEDFEEYFK